MSKAHNHTPMQIREMDGNFVETPHTCDDPACPGNINRQKLEMFDEMYKFIQAFSILVSAWEYPSLHEESIDIVNRAKEIQEEGELWI